MAASIERRTLRVLGTPRDPSEIGRKVPHHQVSWTLVQGLQGGVLRPHLFTRKPRVEALMLDTFIAAHRAEIVARSRAKVAMRSASRPTALESDDSVLFFLGQVIDALQGVTLSPRALAAIDGAATSHGGALHRMGFAVADVIHDYGDIFQVVTELARELQFEMTSDEVQIFSRCLDVAIAQAVTEYARTRDLAVAEEETERMGALSHELRNALSTAMLAFQNLKTGTVGIGGSSAAVLDRSLRRACALIDSSVARVRLEAGIRAAEQISLRQFIEEVKDAASVEASALHVSLSVAPVAWDIDVIVDRELLSGAVINLLQNAFKFTRPEGVVSLKTSSTPDRVLIAVEDECGGLPSGKAEDLFRPFKQQSANRTGLGLGLSISRKNVEAIGGEIRLRDLPGVGCIFTIDLPRVRLAV
ncbi:MAG: HAMP domain-containing sensor histidine kinase [Polyangiaceae bacterium]